MLLLELNAPEHVLETINFQTLTAFWWAFHIVEISICCCHLIQGLIAQADLKSSCVAEAGLKLLILAFKSWNYSHVPQTPNLIVDLCVGIKGCAGITGSECTLLKFKDCWFSEVKVRHNFGMFWCVFLCKVFIRLLYLNLCFWNFSFSNTFHILRPTKAPGFVYAWLELISHRIFIARMLAHTPQQKVWLQFISYRWSL